MVQVTRGNFVSYLDVNLSTAGLPGLAFSVAPGTPEAEAASRFLKQANVQPAHLPLSLDLGLDLEEEGRETMCRR